ncbi:hypothetical protein [Cellulophaga baltica]|uniref:Uncharacterized protein n=1 Tax=Cellulophaga baltica TaxID=76594 RepID=A0A1G7M7G6_9FLAO|nr:hypothetical protein [Cellulophaga baltica]SDF57606.1 hypothetical protein SAMN04487992_1336 [Cellulophaga baltica]
MKVSQKIEFWNWLYSLGDKYLTEEVFDLLKTDFIYKNKEIVSELDGEKYIWNFESILIDLPIVNKYSFYSLIQLNGKGEFEENLYLKKNNDYYALGWIDCHNHEMVFRFEEFYLLMDFLKIKLSEKQFNTYFLFLARFVTLTNEECAEKLMTDAIKHYSNLLNTNEDKIYNIIKFSNYGNKIYGLDYVIKIKNIHSLNFPLRYTINEGILWKKSSENIYTLEGFGAHSMRSKHFNNGLNKPIDIYDIKINLDDYKFPNEIWSDMMKKLLTTMVTVAQLHNL